jgi:DNA-binding GntR family transcriptional regulator
MVSDEDKELLRKMLEARQAHEEAAAAEKAAKKEKDETELDVFERFEESGQMGTLTVDLGEPWGVVSFRSRETHYAQIIDADEVQEHYEQRAMLDEVSAPKFVKKRLNEDVRQAIELGQSPPPGLSYYTDRGITVTRKKGG